MRDGTEAVCCNQGSEVRKLAKATVSNLVIQWASVEISLHKETNCSWAAEETFKHRTSWIMELSSITAADLLQRGATKRRRDALKLTQQQQQKRKKKETFKMNTLRRDSAWIHLLNHGNSVHEKMHSSVFIKRTHFLFERKQTNTKTSQPMQAKLPRCNMYLTTKILLQNVEPVQTLEDIFREEMNGIVVVALFRSDEFWKQMKR
jgi:hypothetical protein